MDYHDPLKKKQQQDLLTADQDQIDDLDVFLVRSPSSFDD